MSFPVINGEPEAPGEIQGLTQAVAQAACSLGVPLLSSLNDFLGPMFEVSA